MTDSSSWVAGKKNVPNLEVLFKGDKFLLNTYHALDQPESTTPGVSWAAKFTDFIASDKGQRTKGAITGDVSATVSEIAAIMTEKTIHRLPITEEGELVEIAARPDILKSQPESLNIALGIKKANRPQDIRIKQLQGFGTIRTTEKGVV